MRRPRISMFYFRLPVLYVALSGFVWCTIAYISTGYLLPNLVRIVCFVISVTLLIALLVVVVYTLVKLIQKSHKDYLHFSALIYFVLAVCGVLTVAAISVGFGYGLMIRALVSPLPHNNWLVHGGTGGLVYLSVVALSAIGVAVGRLGRKPSVASGVQANNTAVRENVPVP